MKFKRKAGKARKSRRRLHLPENTAGILCTLAAVLCCFRRAVLTQAYGEYGSAYYALAFGCFALFFSIGGLGLYHATATMVSDRKERGEYQSAVKALRAAVLYALLTGILLGGIGCLLSGFLAEKLLALPLAVFACRIFAVSVLPMSVFFALLGGIEGLEGGSQASFVRFCFYLPLFAGSLFLTGSFWAYGQKAGAFFQSTQHGPAYGAVGGALSFLCAAVFSMLLASVVWLRLKRQLPSLARRDSLRELNLYRSLFLKSLPCLLPGLLCSVCVLGDLLMYLTGKKEQADALLFAWGGYTGKTWAILGIFALAAFAFGRYMLPGMQVGFLNRNVKKSRAKCMITLRCMALMTVPATVLTAVLARPVILAFFPKTESFQTAELMQIDSLCLIFIGTAVSLGFVLYSMDSLLDIVGGMLLTAVLHLGVFFVLLHVLDMGIYAAACTNLLSAFILCILFLFSVQRHLRIRISWIRVFLPPLIGGAVMAAVCAVLGMVLLKDVPAVWNVLLSGIVGLLFYFVTVIVLKGATARELRQYPGGELLLAAARFLRLM